MMDAVVGAEVVSFGMWAVIVAMVAMIAAAMYDPRPVEMMGDHRKVAI
jgi:hypothetical protein